jgi:hypothetical protein
MKKLLLGLLFVCSNVFAAGTAGLNYETYAAGGPQPSIYNRTLLSRGSVSTINFGWGSGYVLNSGRAEGVIVKFSGYINIPTSGTYYFGGNADDGLSINIGNTNVLHSWIENGGDFRYGVVNLTAGILPIEVWYYENGGGALVNLQWFMNNSWQIVPTSVLATDSTYWVPALCCGASSSAFNATPSNTTKAINFVNRTSADSQVYIEQIGNFNDVTVNQQGTRNNYAKYSGVGDSNDVTINQSGNASTTSNYTDLTINGSYNTVSITQQSTGGAKGAFVNVTNNNNNVNLLQKDNGNHYSEINLSGGNKTVGITQQGSAAHMSNVTLSGNPSSLSLTQSGAIQQHYSINYNCATAGGCAGVTVIQGQ